MSRTPSWVGNTTHNKGYAHQADDDESAWRNMYGFPGDGSPFRPPETTTGWPTDNIGKASPAEDPTSVLFSRLSPDRQHAWVPERGLADAPEAVGGPNPGQPLPARDPGSDLPQVTPSIGPEHISFDYYGAMREKIPAPTGFGTTPYSTSIYAAAAEPGIEKHAEAYAVTAQRLMNPGSPWPPPNTGSPVWSSSPFAVESWKRSPRPPPSTGELDGDREHPKQEWYRRRKWRTLLALALLALLACGLGIGLGIGLSVKNEQSSSAPPTSHPSGPSDPPDEYPGVDNLPNNDTPDEIATDFASVCSQTFCNQTLAATEFDGKVHVFARGVDELLYRRAWNLTGWDEDEWESMGNAGPIAGPPVVLTWTPASGVERLDVFAIGKLGRNLLGRNYIGSNGRWSEWESWPGPFEARPALCTVNGRRLEIFLVDRKPSSQTPARVLHNSWYPEDSNFRLYPEWDASSSGNLPALSAAAAVCRDGESDLDLYAYAANGSVQSTSWIGRPGIYDYGEWNGWRSYGGGFVGDPLVLSLSGTAKERVDFFGIGVDLQMYHGWRDSVSEEMGEIRPVGGGGGRFASMPSVASPVDGVMDAVATGTDGRLMHSRWTDDSDEWSAWEDLGISSNSAPLLVETGDHTTLMILGRDAQLLISSWETRADMDFKVVVQEFRSAGGRFATDFSAAYAA